MPNYIDEVMKEFNEKYPHYMETALNLHHRDEFADFLKSALETQRNEILMGMPKEKESSFNADIFEDGYNQAIKDIKHKLGVE